MMRPAQVATLLASLLIAFNVGMADDLDSLGEKLDDSERYGSAAFTPDGRFLITGEEIPAGQKGAEKIPRRILIWDFETRQITGELTGHQVNIVKLVVSGDGRFLASLGHDFEDDPDSFPADDENGSKRKKPRPAARPSRRGRGGFSELRLWDLKTLEQIPLGDKIPLQPGACEFFPDNRRMAIGAMGEVCVLDLETMSVRTTLKHATTDEVWALAVSPDGRSIASGGSFMGVKVWDVPEEGKSRMRGVLECPGFVQNGLAYSPDGKCLVAGSTGPAPRWSKALFKPDGHALLVFDARNGKLLRSLPGHPLYPRQITFSGDGKTLATASMDDVVQIWSYPEFKSLYRGHLAVATYTLALSPDGKWLVTSTSFPTQKTKSDLGFYLRIWNTEELVRRGAPDRKAR